MSDEEVLGQFDKWLTEDSEFAALVMRQWLIPVEGEDAVIFPPTYAPPKGTNAKEWLGYNIDGEGDSNVCQIDSVGSQANRMEKIFKHGEYKRLVPQIVIKAESAGGKKEINLLDAGHRGADAIVRFSKLDSKLHEAFWNYREGNAEPLAKIAPTSIVFGSWDSRATQVGIPRIVRSTIRAYNVRVLHRSAQYSTIAGEILESGDVEVTTEGSKAELGLAHVPAPWTHGGIQVLGKIQREAALQLETIRGLAAPNKDDNGASLRLRQYILGLALVCFTAPTQICLREGCELVPSSTRQVKWELVKHDGTREEIHLRHENVLSFAKVAANQFGVGGNRGVKFDAERANLVRDLKKEDRKKLRKQGPITKEKIEKLKRESTSKGKAKDAEDGAQN
jgi:CRISPR-associated protein Csb1